MAHDFNNLLSVILGNLQLLEGQIGDDEVASGRVRSALAAVRSGAELSSRLLSFGRRQRLHSERIALGGFLAHFHELVSRTLKENIAIEIEHSEVDVVVECDRVQLESALLNLAINARDAMPNGGRLTVSVNVREIDETYTESVDDLAAGAYVEISVSDSGEGSRSSPRRPPERAAAWGCRWCTGSPSSRAATRSSTASPGSAPPFGCFCRRA